MDQILRKLSEEYINVVEQTCTLMLQGFNLSTRTELLKYGFENQVGEFYLNGKNSYMFHGIGCEFKNDRVKIDWDFGVNNKWCGIDPWKIYFYLKDNSTRNKKVFDVKYIKKEYDEAVETGEMVKRDGLYYFAI